MPTSFLEIVELPDGRIELRRAEDEGSLVTLDFSDDAKAFLQGQHVEIAKAMLSVGVQMAGRMVEGEFDKEEAAGSSLIRAFAFNVTASDRLLCPWRSPALHTARSSNPQPKRIFRL